VRAGRRLGWTAALLAAALLACRPAPATGPRTLAFDRETCEHCQMVISDRVTAVEVRLAGERALHVFDDLGCALVWLDARDARAQELWVRSADGADWSDGLSARYAGGRPTPMGYGFVPAEGPGLALEEVQQRVRAIEAERRAGAR